MSITIMYPNGRVAEVVAVERLDPKTFGDFAFWLSFWERSNGGFW